MLSTISGFSDENASIPRPPAPRPAIRREFGACRQVLWRDFWWTEKEIADHVLFMINGTAPMPSKSEVPPNTRMLWGSCIMNVWNIVLVAHPRPSFSFGADLPRPPPSSVLIFCWSESWLTKRRTSKRVVSGLQKLEIRNKKSFFIAFTKGPLGSSS